MHPYSFCVPIYDGTYEPRSIIWPRRRYLTWSPSTRVRKTKESLSIINYNAYSECCARPNTVRFRFEIFFKRFTLHFYFVYLPTYLWNVRTADVSFGAFTIEIRTTARTVLSCVSPHTNSAPTQKYYVRWIYYNVYS